MSFLTIIICGFLYAIKGGSGNFLKNWNYVRAKNKILHRLLDGKVLSTLLFWVFITAVTGNGLLGIFMALAWLAAVAPSMGEEHGAVGRWGYAWGPYIDHPEKFGRRYGVNKSIHRGVWMGACFTVVTGFPLFLWFSLLYVPCVFIGQQINRWILKTDGWTLAEPIIGAIVIGAPLAYFLQGA